MKAIVKQLLKAHRMQQNNKIPVFIPWTTKLKYAGPELFKEFHGLYRDLPEGYGILLQCPSGCLQSICRYLQAICCTLQSTMRFLRPVMRLLQLSVMLLKSTVRFLQLTVRSLQSTVRFLQSSVCLLRLTANLHEIAIIMILLTEDYPALYNYTGNTYQQIRTEY